MCPPTVAVDRATDATLPFAAIGALETRVSRLGCIIATQERVSFGMVRYFGVPIRGMLVLITEHEVWSWGNA